MTHSTLKPTDSELEILQVLWDSGPSSVRYVNENLNTTKEVGYTTTLKLMQIMNEKGLTVRDTTSRTHVYTAAIKEIAAKNNLLAKFIDSTFQGSAAKLVMQTLGNNETTQEELAAIKIMIKNLEKND